jgi:folate-binding protein YgfZ
LTKDNSRACEAFSSGAALVRRSDVGRLLVTGHDRGAYLQGLLTNDVAALTPGEGCYAAMLTAQGRMISDMYVDEIGDAMLLRLPVALTTQIREHLDRFIFAEDVQISDVSSAKAQIGIYGPLATEVGSHASRALRLAADDLPGVALVIDTDAVEAVVQGLNAAGAIEATADEFEIARIEAAVPRFGVDMDTETIPLEAGIEDRAISRTKGCYVGQEVIVRVLDRGRGRVARRLVQLAFDAGAPVPVHGATVHAAGRDVGHITSAVYSPRFGCVIALGYVRREFATDGTTVIVDGIPATVRERLV